MYFDRLYDLNEVHRILYTSERIIPKECEESNGRQAFLEREDSTVFPNVASQDQR